LSAAPPALAASRTLGQVSGLSSDTFMGVRHEFEDLHALGQLPAGDQLSPEQAHRYEEALSRLPDAPTGEEAAALVSLLPPDETTSFGLAWTLVHTIESSPDWPVTEVLDASTWWRSQLEDRIAKSS